MRNNADKVVFFLAILLLFAGCDSDIYDPTSEITVSQQRANTSGLEPADDDNISVVAHDDSASWMSSSEAVYLGVGGSDEGGGGSVGRSCGDGFCDPGLGENPGSCPQDCGFCGDNLCQPVIGEDLVSCPADCSACGNGVCEASLGEDPLSCPVDCGLVGDDDDSAIGDDDDIAVADDDDSAVADDDDSAVADDDDTILDDDDTILDDDDTILDDDDTILDDDDTILDDDDSAVADDDDTILDDDDTILDDDDTILDDDDTILDDDDSAPGDGSPCADDEGGDEERAPLCGDGLCEFSEDCSTCPGDCGECPCDEFPPLPESLPSSAAFAISEAGSGLIPMTLWGSGGTTVASGELFVGGDGVSAIYEREAQATIRACAEAFDSNVCVEGQLTGASVCKQSTSCEDRPVWDVAWDETCCEAQIAGQTSTVTGVSGEVLLGINTCTVDLSGMLTMGAELASQAGPNCGCAEGQTTTDLWARLAVAGIAECVSVLGGTTITTEASVAASSEIRQVDTLGCDEGSSFNDTSNVSVTLPPTQAGWLRVGPAIVHRGAEGGSHAN